MNGSIFPFTGFLRCPVFLTHSHIQKKTRTTEPPEKESFEKTRPPKKADLPISLWKRLPFQLRPRLEAHIQAMVQATEEDGALRGISVFCGTSIYKLTTVFFLLGP